MQKGQIKNIRDYFEQVLIAIFLALIVRTFILSGYKVPTISMAPTLMPGDFIFTFKSPYGFSLPFTNYKIGANPPNRGDVVVFTFSEGPNVVYSKRVIGLPGDHLQIVKGKLQINGKLFSYEKPKPQTPPLSINDLSDLESTRLKWELAPEGKRLILSSKEEKSFGPIVVPPGEIFLLGDNRDTSDDSRYWGTVPIERVEGKVFLIWLSLNWQKRWGGDHFPSLRYDRFFSLIR